MIMNLLDLIKHHEGCSLRAYKCPAGKTTIGWGHNCDDNPIPQSVADRLLDLDIAVARATCIRLFPIWSHLGEVRQAVLVDMAYNLGEGGLRSFLRMRRCIEALDWAGAARELLDSKAARELGSRYRCLARMMESGKW